jgi:hypothetical protein
MKAVGWVSVASRSRMTVEAALRLEWEAANSTWIQLHRGQVFLLT